MILCCGEALIDMIPQQTASGETSFLPKSGGSVFNTAIGLGRLGADVGMIGGISNDLFGAQLISDLRQSNVDTSRVLRSDRPSTLAFVHLVDGQANYSFFDENSAGRQIEFSDLPTQMPEADALFFGGISLVSEPGADALLELAVRHASSKLIMLDPNIRPSFIEDEETYRHRLNKLISRADIVKISDEDLNWVLPGQEPLRTKAASLLAMGPKLVLLTLGAKGVVAISDLFSDVTVEPPETRVVDTVGAGDSFNSGFLYALWEQGLAKKSGLSSLNEDTLARCLGYATQVAGFVVGQRGAVLPWASQLEQ